MKITVLSSRDSPYNEYAKSMLIRLSREMEIDYEIVEVKPGEEPVIARGKELPCFVLDEKVVMSGKPSYEDLKRLLKRGNGFFGMFRK